MSLTYRDAGVDIDEGDRLVELIKPHARPTLRPEVLAGIGGFGGLFALDVKKYQRAGAGLRHRRRGHQAQGGLRRRPPRHGRHRPGRHVRERHRGGRAPSRSSSSTTSPPASSQAEQGAEVVKGIAEGCRQAGCALIGGETAELPGFYARRRVRPGRLRGGLRRALRASSTARSIAPGDVVIGVASSGLHSNGYSLARKALLDRHPLDQRFAALGGRTLAELLLEPTRIYAKDVLGAAGAGAGEGLRPHHRRRARRATCRAACRTAPGRSWRSGAGRARRSSTSIEREGQVPRDEMYRTFNMGLGLVAMVAAGDEAAAHAALAARGLPAWTVGGDRARRGRGHLRGRGVIRLGVLASGGGTNLQALLDACAARRIDATWRWSSPTSPGPGRSSAPGAPACPPRCSRRRA